MLDLSGKEMISITIHPQPTSISLAQTSTTLAVGSSYEISTPELNPTGTTTGALIGSGYSYSSSNSGVATVTNDGVVTARGAGNAVITVKHIDSNITATLNVTVPQPPSAPVICTVSFNANGGSVSPASKSVTVGSGYGTLPTPTKSGQTFIGWFTAATGGSPVTTYTTVTNSANHTLYAHWQVAQTVTVTFDSNLRAGWDPTFSLVDMSYGSKTVTVGSTYGAMPTPSTQIGFVFVAWITSSDLNSPRATSSTVVTNSANHTLYALWKRDMNTTEQWYVNGSGSAWFSCLSNGTPFGPNKTFYSNGTYIYVDGYDNYMGFWKASGNTITHYVWIQANNGAWIYDGISTETGIQRGTWASSSGGGSYYVYPSSIADMTSIWRNLRM
jgi:uncharacterized repeat protein (TIGR02543 family)